MRRPARSKITLHTVVEDKPIEVPVLAGPPDDWSPGALLNVRNCGHEYRITIYPEEFDPEHPERTVTFTNPGECQDFVSRWYWRQHHDPRAK